MAKKTAAPKKRNPQDATVERNIGAMKKRHDKLKARVKRLEKRLAKLSARCK